MNASTQNGNIGDLADHIPADIRAAAIYSNVDRVILFGSRALGTHTETSRCLRGDVARMQRCLAEDICTLLTFDVVDIGRPVSPELLEVIEPDGIVLVAKT